MYGARYVRSEEAGLGSRSLRIISAMGFVAVIATTVLYLMAVRTTTDTDTPRVAALVRDAFERNLAPGTRAALTMRLVGDGKDRVRHYVLRMTPSEAVAADERSLRVLSSQAADLVLREIETAGPPPLVTSVLVLPDATEERVTYDARMARCEEPGGAAPAGDEGDEP